MAWAIWRQRRARSRSSSSSSLPQPEEGAEPPPPQDSDTVVAASIISRKRSIPTWERQKSTLPRRRALTLLASRHLRRWEVGLWVMVFFHNRLDEFVSLGLSDAMGATNLQCNAGSTLCKFKRIQRNLKRKKRYGVFHFLNRFDTAE